MTFAALLLLGSAVALHSPSSCSTALRACQQRVPLTSRGYAPRVAPRAPHVAAVAPAIVALDAFGIVLKVTWRLAVAAGV